jgi:hypothetical protein
MARLNHEKHLEYCRWYYLKNREKLKQMALFNYYRKHGEIDAKLDEKKLNS